MAVFSSCVDILLERNAENNHLELLLYEILVPLPPGSFLGTDILWEVLWVAVPL